MERTEKCKAGLYDIASGKLTTLDIEGNIVFPSFGANGKMLVVMTFEGVGSPTDIKVCVTPRDKIKFRTIDDPGLPRSISPTSDLMVLLLVTEGEKPRPGRCVLYDLKTDTIKVELAGQDQSRRLMENNPQWTTDGRYLYHVIHKNEERDGRSHSEVLTRIWDPKAGKEVGILSGVAPIGPGPGKGTMVLVRLPGRPRMTPPAAVDGNKAAKVAEPAPRTGREIVLHAQDDKTLGQKLHPLGDKLMRPISTQGKWLLFIRKDADGAEKACLAEIVLPKK
jgi:hypothetical protein